MKPGRNGENCARCVFVFRDIQAGPTGKDMTTLTCHRSPPQIVQGTESSVGGRYGEWPEVAKDDWCGEFQEPT